MSDCTNRTFPFTYYDAGGNVVPGVAGDDGICTFEEANCGPDTHVHDCCSKNDGAEGFNMSTGGNLLLLGLIASYGQIIWMKRCGRNETEEEREQREDKAPPGWVKELPEPFQRIFKMGIIAFILPMILMPIFMNESVQSSLSVSHRNALLGAQAFMDPYKDIFQFIEDIVLIRVSYTLASGDKKQTNNLVHVGILGALIAGLVAAVIGTILGAIPQSLSVLTNPGAANDASAYPGCDFFAEYESSVVMPYWIIQMWGIPGQLLGLVLSGFMFGAREHLTGGWLIGIGLSVVPAIWHGGGASGITLLGIAESVSSWVFPAIAFVYMACPLGKDLREHTGFTFKLRTCKNILCGSSSTSEAHPLIEDENDDEIVTEELPEAPSNKSLIIDGVKVMAIDVITQVTISIGVYLALVSDASVGYQITAVQAALPQIGVAYAFSLAFVFKLRGPEYLVKREYESFTTFTWVTILCAFIMLPIIIGGVESFAFGENACEYAKDDTCVGFFTEVFGENGTGGQYTLRYTWNAIVYGGFIDVLNLTTRAILLTCNDFDYALKCTFVATIVYIPAIIVVNIGNGSYVNEAISLFIVMYLPQAVLSILFLGRIFDTPEGEERRFWSVEGAGHQQKPQE